MSKKNKPIIAIVGAGKWGKNLIREFDKVAKIKSIYHRGSKENSKWLQINYPSIRIVSSYKDIINDRKIDAVIIATPIKTHFNLAKKALESGKNVFVEKPMAENKKDAKKLISIARKNKLILFTGFTFTFDEAFLKLQKVLLKEKAKSISFYWNKFGSFIEKIELNLFSHELSLVLSLLGKISKINILEKSGLISHVDIFKAQTKSKNNCLINFNIDRVSDFKKKVIKIQTSKNLYILENLELKKLDRKIHEFKTIFKSKKTPLEVECQSFVNSIKKKNKTTNEELSLEVTKVLDQIK